MLVFRGEWPGPEDVRLKKARRNTWPRADLDDYLDAPRAAGWVLLHDRHESPEAPAHVGTPGEVVHLKGGLAVWIKAAANEARIHVSVSADDAPWTVVHGAAMTFPSGAVRVSMPLDDHHSDWVVPSARVTLVYDQRMALGTLYVTIDATHSPRPEPQPAWRASEPPVKIESLLGLGPRWSTVRGTLREWSDQALLEEDRARRRERAEASHETTTAHPEVHDGRTYTVVTSSSHVSHAGDVSAKRKKPKKRRSDVWEVVTSLTARADPPGLRLEALRASFPLPLVHVQDGQDWWTLTDELESNVGRPHRGSPWRQKLTLLDPSDLAQSFVLEPAGRDVVAGHECLAFDARPRTHQAATSLDMDPGGDLLLLYVEPIHGVLLRAVKVVDGEPAEIREFTDITFDEPLDDAASTPPRP